MPNFASIINSHNKKIINSNIPKPSTPACNCRSKSTKTHSYMKVNIMPRNYQISYGKINMPTPKRILCGIYQVKPGPIKQKQKVKFTQLKKQTGNEISS